MTDVFEEYAHKRAREAARKLLHRGVSQEIVADAMNLSLEEVRELAEKQSAQRWLLGFGLLLYGNVRQQAFFVPFYSLLLVIPLCRLRTQRARVDIQTYLLLVVPLCQLRIQRAGVDIQTYSLLVIPLCRLRRHLPLQGRPIRRTSVTIVRRISSPCKGEMPSLRGREGIRARISSPYPSQAMLARPTVFTALALVKTGSQRQGSWRRRRLRGDYRLRTSHPSGCYAATLPQGRAPHAMF